MAMRNHGYLIRRYNFLPFQLMKQLALFRWAQGGTTGTIVTASHSVCSCPSINKATAPPGPRGSVLQTGNRRTHPSHI